MKYTIRLIELAGRPNHPCTLRGYLKTFLPHAFGGRGFIQVTENPKEAIHFDSLKTAQDMYLTQSSFSRPDGKPSRPLTAYTVVFEPLLEDVC